MLEPQPISDRPAGLGFPHRAGRFQPGVSPFSSAGCRMCTCMEGFLNRGWGPILTGCGEILGFPRGTTPAARASTPHSPGAGGEGACHYVMVGPKFTLAMLPFWSLGCTTCVTLEVESRSNIMPVVYCSSIDPVARGDAYNISQGGEDKLKSPKKTPYF